MRDKDIPIESKVCKTNGREWMAWLSLSVFQFTRRSNDLIVGSSVFVSFELNVNGIGKGKNNPNQPSEAIGGGAAGGIREGFLRFVSRGLFSGRRLDGTLTEFLEALTVTAIPPTLLTVFSVVVPGEACAKSLYFTVHWEHKIQLERK